MTRGRIHRVSRRIASAAHKNGPEFLAWVTGRMPSFVYARRKFSDIPVFCFHSARYPEFEQQLGFLAKNGYRTLTSDELLERVTDPGYRNDGKEIVLTFDDGMASVWAVAFPLLRKYGFRIVSFVLPGLTEEAGAPGPTIDDVNGQDKVRVSQRDYGDNPLCSWEEIAVMHQSGLVDFQSHGLHHALIATSPKIVDFIHPGFDEYHYGNIHIPFYHDGVRDGVREKVLGHPVYASDSRFKGCRYFDPVQVRRACADFVDQNGGISFFERSDWRKRLKKVATQAWGEGGRYETREEAVSAIRQELSESREDIERRLGKRVHHFCFPWFRVSDLAARLAYEMGYKSTFVGAMPFCKRHPRARYPCTITRVQEEYLYCLPGDGGRSTMDAWRHKWRGREMRARVPE